MTSASDWLRSRPLARRAEGAHPQARCLICRYPSWRAARKATTPPYTSIRPITFDHDVAKADDVVLIHLNHRLVQMCLQLMRAEVWAQKDNKKLHRIDVRTLPAAALEALRAGCVPSSDYGGGHHRLHEELTLSGGYLNDKVSDARQRWACCRAGKSRQQSTVHRSPFASLSQRFVGMRPRFWGPLRRAPPRNP